MALMAQRAGVAPWAATGSAVILQMLAIGTGAAVAGLTGRMRSKRPARGGSGTRRAGRGRRRRVWGCCSGLRSCAGCCACRAGRRSPDGTRRATAIAFGVVANLVAWVGYGVALWLLARGLLPGAGLELVPAIAVFTASYLAGFLALIAPGGLGVREGLFILMLQGPLGHRGGDGARASLRGCCSRSPSSGPLCRFWCFPGRSRVSPTESAVEPFEPRRPALLAGCVLRRSPPLTLCWPMLIGQFLLGDDQYIAGYGFRLFGAEMFRADRQHPAVESRTSSAGCRSSRRMHGDIFYPTAWLRWILPIDTAMNLGFALHFVLAGCDDVRAAARAADRVERRDGRRAGLRAHRASWPRW